MSEASNSSARSILIQEIKDLLQEAEQLPEEALQIPLNNYDYIRLIRLCLRILELDS